MSSAIAVFGGHHYDARGAVAADGRTEYEIVRDVFLWRLRDALRIIGTPGTLVPDMAGGKIQLKAAQAKSNAWPVRLALDLHLNASEDKSVKGLRICYHDTAPEWLVKRVGIMANRLRAGFHPLSDDRDGFAEHMEKVGIPALVIELAFISNPLDLAAAEREAGERMIDMARTLLQVFPPGP